MAFLRTNRRNGPGSAKSTFLLKFTQNAIFFLLGASIYICFSSSSIDDAGIGILLTSTVQDSNTFSKAKTESLNFFDDIDEKRWNRLRERFQKSRPNSNPRRGSKMYREHANHPMYFWTENYDPEFTCESEMKFGPISDGGKWVCDPHRIDKNNCLVYSVGSHGDFSFEEAVLSGVSKSCEVHTFDRVTFFNRKQFKPLADKAGVIFHHTSLGKPTTQFPNGKRFKEIVSDLKHEGKTIDIMKIDCEGCEWDQYQDWLDDWKEMNLTVRQVLIELHQSPLPQTPDFFDKMLERGYVIFHREGNNINNLCYEYSFVLLDTAFQKSD